MKKISYIIQNIAVFLRRHRHLIGVIAGAVLVLAILISGLVWAISSSHHSASTKTQNKTSKTTKQTKPKSSTPSKSSATTTTPTSGVKQSKSLVISPATVTIYRDTTGAKGAIAGSTDAKIKVSTADGGTSAAPTLDVSSGISLDSDTSLPAVSWVLTAGAGKASVGTHAVKLTTTSADGTIAYSGSLTIKVAVMPHFSVTSATLASHTTAMHTYTFAGLDYTNTDADEFTPDITVTGGITCDGLSYNTSAITCTSTTAKSGTYTLSFTFLNRFQRVTVPATVTIN